LLDTTTPVSESDAQLLASLEGKLQVVRDRVQGVAEGYYAGFYLFGEGGTSKSFTVEETLKRLNTSYKLTNSRVTGKGLFKLLREFPDTVHVIEDAETMFSDRNTAGVLRSALWGQAGPNGQQERTVCWQTGQLRDEFVFTGGVIVLANCGLDDVPQLRALKTRIPCAQYAPTNEEVAALMRVIARKGHQLGPHHLAPEKCLEVAETIIDHSARLTKNLDLRLLVNTFNDRLQYDNGAAKTHWVDLLESRMKERVVAPAAGCGIRAQKNAQEVEVAGRIRNLPTADRLAVWKAETGKSRAEMYRALSQQSHLSQIPGPSQESPGGETNVSQMVA
jgi:hypothetical protein